MLNYKPPHTNFQIGLDFWTNMLDNKISKLKTIGLLGLDYQGIKDEQIVRHNKHKEKSKLLCIVEKVQSKSKLYSLIAKVGCKGRIISLTLYYITK